MTSELPEIVHEQARERFTRAGNAAEALGLKISFARLVLFSAGVGFIGVALARGRIDSLLLGGISALAFVIAVVWHASVMQRRDRALVRKAVHERHLARIAGRTDGHPDGASWVSPEHPYAYDLDVVGPGSLFERIAVAHTSLGAARLAQWLCDRAPLELIRARQKAVRELAPNLEFRQELEATLLDSGQGVLDPAPFLALAKREPFVLSHPALRAASFALPLVTVVTVVFSGDVLPSAAWLIPVTLQGLIAWRTQSEVAERYALLSSRRRLVESFRAVLEVLERAEFEAPLLQHLSQRLLASGQKPTAALRSLEMWSSLFDLRLQGIVHVFVDLFVLWDLHCLANVERWMKKHGDALDRWFDVLAEFEALSSLAGMVQRDPSLSFPEVGEPGSPLVAERLVHPLIAPASRVANDVRLDGPACALVITGSNMAGKSTLLRALGVNVALALAGGAVSAARFFLPEVRMRASMRIADSVQSGSSYFQAELSRLKVVIEKAEERPPVLFLLDELLRGTNARARHKGARAVVAHLLSRNAMGLVATHDVALSELEGETGGRVRNVHFTDVFEDGEMKFDYRLRPGVVRTSNALRLLRLAGVEVEADDALTDAAPVPA